MTRLRWWLWVAGAVLLAALGCAVAITFTAPAKRLEAELRRQRARGTLLTMAELAPPQVPADENAAVLYQQAFTFLPQGPDAELIHRFVSLEDGPPEKVQFKDLERVVAASAPALRLLAEAAERPACQFPVNWEDGYFAMFDHLGRIRHCARLLAAKAILDARHGNTSEALNAIATILRMAEHIAPEPCTLSQLVRIACQYYAVHGLNRIAQIAPLSASEARRMYKVLRPIDNMGPFTRAMQGERCAALLAFTSIARDPRWGLGPFPLTPNNPRIQWWSAQARFLLSVPSFYQAQFLYLQYADKAIELSRKPYREVRARMAKLDRSVEPLNRYTIFSQLSPGFGALTIQVRDRAIALIGLGEHGMALEVFRQQTGHYPASLAELRKKVNWPLPDDPFSGKDFVYRRERKGYIIYSIGPNMKDDGGKDRYSARGRWRQGHRPPDDISWRITR